MLGRKLMWFCADNHIVSSNTRHVLQQSFLLILTLLDCFYLLFLDVPGWILKIVVVFIDVPLQGWVPHSYVYFVL